MSSFTGFPVAALDFYDDLEIDNTRSFWTAHKATYDDAVRAPMMALTAALEPEFGPAKVFRPFRDVRYAKDKTPYKTHQGAFVERGPSTGWYIEIAAAGVRVGAGFYDAPAELLARIRQGIHDERRGRKLERLIAGLEADGWSLSGTTVKTAPRGYDVTHPRIRLLRHKTMTLGRSYGFEPVIHTPALFELVRTHWAQTLPLIEWVTDLA